MVPLPDHSQALDFLINFDLDRVLFPVLLSRDPLEGDDLVQGEIIRCFRSLLNCHRHSDCLEAVGSHEGDHLFSVCAGESDNGEVIQPSLARVFVCHPL